MTAGGENAQSVGSVTLLDSSFTDTGVAITTAHDPRLPTTAGSLILDNISLVNTPAAVQGPSGTVLVGGTKVINGWGQGHEYTPKGPVNFETSIIPLSRPSSLTLNGRFYARSKPQYQSLPVSQFVSVRSYGAKGDGMTDDTVALTKGLTSAAASGKVLFIDAGTYKVTSTVLVPAGSKIVGEAYSVIMGSGSTFSNIKAPIPVVKVGSPGGSGTVEWSDMIVSTQGATAGAILIEWNLASTTAAPSGMWDVHTRIGGFAGSNLQVAQCPASNAAGQVNQNCIAAWLSMYIAPSATGLYMENTWFWTADHDIEDPNETRVTVYAGRGLYCASTAGQIWMVGTAVEHHDMYQYQFASTQNIFAGQIQTETAYYQPVPKAGTVFPIVSGWNDPNFASNCSGVAGNCADGWGLRVITSQNVLIYGAGLYSFFNDYNTSKPLLKRKHTASNSKPACSNPVVAPGNGAACQMQIFSIEGTCKNIDVYNLNTIGAAQMVTRNGVSLASYANNVNVYPDTIALFKSN